MEYLSPLSSSLYIMQNAEHICENSDCPFNLNCWANQELTPSATDERSIEWIFVTSLLNFSFWSNSLVNFEVLFRNKTYTGYWALCAAINRALDEGPDILNPKVYQSMTVEQLRHIFRSHTAESIPLFDERLNTLKDAGKTLLEHFNGSFKNALFSCDNSAAKLLKLLCDYFPSFRDYALYKGKQGEEIANGSELEVEIRAATISAVHNIVKFMKSKNAKWNSILVDNFLWYYRRSHANEIDAKVPMHRTRCIYY
ncbi:Queuosine salvage protein isoform 4 [Schistosoma japonicum]|uniref:Queuosine 5'-phosphate N-glycosylase/hydrolase n=1 Tax=Schistosoma japonicum TaxID=6182 RepID=A0A4Z2DM50_SCHJA|nr:Queuosine salvage protein isoform 4 [Schistosoma japonicum]